MSTAGYIYATRMPTGNIKVGMGRNAKRAEAGKTFGPIEVLKIWKVADRRVAEKLAHNVIAHLRVGKRELFQGTGEQIVGLIDSVLTVQQSEIPVKEIDYYAVNAAADAARDAWELKQRPYLAVREELPYTRGTKYIDGKLV
jgi:hypothetical protein